MNIGLSNNSSQMIEPKGFKFSKFDRDHSGVIIRKFSEDQSKNPGSGAI